MKSIYFKGSIMLGIIALSFTACKKDQQASVDNEGSISAQENAQADETFSDTFNDISNFSSENDASFSGNTSQTNGLNILSTDEEPDITVTGTGWPKTVTFDYGKGKLKKGILRMGKFKAVYSNRFKIKGSVITVTFEDFKVNNYKIEGMKTITNNGPNAAENYTFTVNVSGILKSDNKGYFTYNAVHTIEWLKGFTTPARSDDEFSITGLTSGTSSKGINFATTIIKPLIKKVTWPYFIAGTIQIQAGDKKRLLDYGDGALDDKATITVNGVSEEIFLRK